jgi:apolipoprotein N-acyltransferase
VTNAARVKLVMALGAGAALPLAFAPFGYYWLAPVSFVLLLLAWSKATPRAAFLYGLAFGLASFSAGMYWVYISIHGYGGAHPALAGIITAAFVAILALFPAVVGWVGARWLLVYGPYAWLAGLPAVWVLAEWCRGWVFSGMGWLSAGYSQADSWLIGYAPVGGVYLVSWAVLTTAGALLTVLRCPGRPRSLALVTLAAVWGGGYLLSQQRFTEPDSAVVTVALAQGAVRQELKWQRPQLLPTLDLYRGLTERAAGSDLIIWPEAAIPALYSQIEDYLADVQRRAATNGSSVLLGVLRAEPQTGAIQNALVALGPQPMFYVKRHLVPYGEYFPVPNFVRDWLRMLNLPYSDISPGPPGQPPLEVAGQRLAVTICYEDVFGAEQLHYLPDATLLVNVSNDAWFGDSVAPHQHLEIARVRAIEAGRYLLRATNTGVSAIIDPSGRVISSAPQFEPALVTGAVQGMHGSTPYALWGNYAVVLLALAAVLGQRPRTKLTMRFGT